MKYLKDYDSVVGIHYKGTEARAGEYANPELVASLGHRGVAALLLPGNSSYDTSSVTAIGLLADVGVVAGKSGFTFVGGNYVEVPIGGAGGLAVVRSRVLTPEHLESQIPVVNGPRLRSIGASKWTQYELARDCMPPTVALEEDVEFSPELIESLIGDKIVAKGDMSQLSQYLSIVARQEVGNAVAAMRAKYRATKGRKRSNERIILQEYVPGQSWSELRGIDEANSQALINAAETELRIFCFVDTEGNVAPAERLHAVARVFDGKEGDDYVFLDQCSVPEEAWATAEVVAEKCLRVAGVRGGYLAVDLIKGILHVEQEAKILVREINTRDPMLVDKDESYIVAYLLRARLANLMSVLAKHKVV